MAEKIGLYPVNDHIWRMEEENACGYIVIGAEKAAVIDTMLGFGNVKEVVRSVTDKPLVVINTHGHCDHVGGNVYFDGAYLHPADNSVVEEYLNEDEVKQYLKEHDLNMPPFYPIRDGDVIDLGGLTLEIIELPEHTPGGILILLAEDRILFTGDSINRHLWMQLDHSLSIEKLAENLEKVLYLETQADTILHGHAKGPEDISLMRKLWEGAKDLLAGNTANDKPYEWFGGRHLQHEFDTDSVICYRADNIKECEK